MEDHRGKQGALDRIMKAVEFFERVNVTEEPEHWDEFVTKVRPWRFWFDERQRCFVLNLKIGEFLTTVNAAMYSSEEWDTLIAHGFYKVECNIQLVSESRGNFCEIFGSLPSKKVTVGEGEGKVWSRRRTCFDG